MQYTKYFSGIINTYGSLNFQPDQLKLVMNLVHLEAKIEAIKALEQRYKTNYNLDLKLHKDQILQLTNGMSPMDLIQQWKMTKNI